MLSLLVCNPLEGLAITTETKRDWKSFEAKLARGLSIQTAAEEAGISDDEVSAYITKRLGTKEGASVELKLIAEKAIQKGLETLIKIAGDGPRFAVSDGQGGGSTPINSDLDAAKALTRLGIDAIKLSKQSNESKSSASGASSPGTVNVFGDLWDLRAPGAD